jgi:large subunit ribosomal protein L9
MATHVQVILTHDVDKLGKAGELVRVRPGYARNFLLPRKLALVATGANLGRVEHERGIAVARATKLRKVAEGTAAQIEGLVLEVPARVGEADRLYGSVTSSDVADALARRGLPVDRKQLQLSESIRTLGDHPITARLGHEVEARFTVRVVASP